MVLSAASRREPASIRTVGKSGEMPETFAAPLGSPSIIGFPTKRTGRFHPHPPGGESVPRINHPAQCLRRSIRSRSE